MAAEHDQIPEAALAWLGPERAVALATVVETWGSAPRPSDRSSRSAATPRWRARSRAAASRAPSSPRRSRRSTTARPRLLEYGVSDADAFAVGLACGGRIRVLVEPVGRGPGAGGRPPRRAGRRPGGAHRRPSTPCEPGTWERRLVAGSDDPLWPAARAALVADRSGFADDWFLGVHNPPLRMAVVGAVHIAQALVPMARLAGYDVLVVDPREAFATRGALPRRRARSTTGPTWRSPPSGSTRARPW